MIIQYNDILNHLRFLTDLLNISPLVFILVLILFFGLDDSEADEDSLDIFEPLDIFDTFDYFDYFDCFDSYSSSLSSSDSSSLDCVSSFFLGFGAFNELIKSS